MFLKLSYNVSKYIYITVVCRNVPPPPYIYISIYRTSGFPPALMLGATGYPNLFSSHVI